MKKILRFPARSGRVRLGAALLVVGVLAVSGGVTKSVLAATTTITITPSQQPAASDAAALSTTGQATYVFYSLTLASKSSWTHVTLSDSRPTVTLNSSPVLVDDAAVVFVSGCPTTPILANGGFSCNIDKLSPGVAQTFNVVVQTPTSGDTLNVDPTVAGDERANDQNASKPDTFPTPLSWSLTADSTDAITSYTNPTQTTSLSTDKHLCAVSTCTVKNPQWTETDVPGGPAPNGILVKMSERGFNTGECPSFATSAGLKCFGQVSQISAPSPGTTNVFTCDPVVVYPGVCANSLTFTVEVSAASLTAKVNLSKAVIFHDTGTGYVKVPRCNAAAPIGPTTSAADCVVNVVQLANHDIQWTVRGPDNGNWGGAG